MKKCVVCKKDIPDGRVRLMYQKDNGEIVHFHLTCEEDFDREKAENDAPKTDL